MKINKIPTKKFYNMDPWRQSYKTFFTPLALRNNNLQRFAWEHSSLLCALWPGKLSTAEHLKVVGSENTHNH